MLQVNQNFQIARNNLAIALTDLGTEVKNKGMIRQVSPQAISSFAFHVSRIMITIIIVIMIIITPMLVRVYPTTRRHLCTIIVMRMRGITWGSFM